MDNTDWTFIVLICVGILALFILGGFFWWKKDGKKFYGFIDVEGTLKDDANMRNG